MRCAGPAADRLDDLHPVAGTEPVAGVRAPGYDFPVHLDRDPSVAEVEKREQAGDVGAVGNLAKFAVELDLHGARKGLIRGVSWGEADSNRTLRAPGKRGRGNS